MDFKTYVKKYGCNKRKRMEKESNKYLIHIRQGNKKYGIIEAKDQKQETISNEKGNNEMLMDPFTKNAYEISNELGLKKLRIQKSIIVLYQGDPKLVTNTKENQTDQMKLIINYEGGNNDVLKEMFIKSVYIKTKMKIIE